MFRNRRFAICLLLVILLTVCLVFIIIVTQQPKNQSIVAGNSLTLSVKATGTGLKNQWNFKKKGQTSFNIWNGRTHAAETVSPNYTWDGIQLYCVVKDNTGKSAQTDTVKINVTQELKITAQPTGKTINLGDSVTLSLKAEGIGLTYQWYFKKAGQTSFTAWNGRTHASETCTPNATWDGIQLYCVVKDASGKKAQSNTVTVKFNSTGITVKPDYLASTGDTTDVTDSIVTMLKQNGVCHLGPGLFCVSGIDLPDDAMLTGSGSNTVVRLTGDGSYAVKMNHRNTVSDLTLEGSDSNITLNKNVGTQHGILWQGDYTKTQKQRDATTRQPTYGILNNLRIRRFTGGGITCSDTGYGTINFIEGTNIIVNNCNAGINISYWSEYHKFTNVRTYGCYYGCINNGGNNTFVNCDFSTCKLGFLMDNANSQSPNNSHGSAVGCVFNHTDSNKGVGIKIVNCNNGYIFTGCQIHFSKTVIRDSSGIVFSSCNCRNDDITITNGGAILFVNNMYASQPKKTITNNNTVRFVNCYVRSDGTAVE